MYMHVHVHVYRIDKDTCPKSLYNLQISIIPHKFVTTRLCVCVCVCVCVLVHMYMYSCIVHVCMRVCMYACVYACMESRTLLHFYLNYYYVNTCILELIMLCNLKVGTSIFL